MNKIFKINNLINFFTKPYILAALITIIYIPFLPDYSKYKAVLIETGRKNPKDILYYSDFNNDGISEKVIFQKDFTGKSAFIVYQDDKIIDQWNFNGKFPLGKFYVIGDCDKNDLNELYVFTCENDSLFITGIEVFSGKETVSRKYITRYFTNNNTIDLSILKPQLIDTDNDGYPELFFCTYGSFVYRPRNLIIYDFQTKSIKSSPTNASCFYEPVLFDIDNDNKPEIMGKSVSYGNSPIDYPLSDQFAWFTVLDDNFDFLFPPLKIGKYSANTTILPITTNKIAAFAVLYFQQGIYDESSLSLYSLQGKLINQKKITREADNIKLITNPEDENNLILLYYMKDGLIEYYDANLNLLKTDQSIPLDKHSAFLKSDIDGDNEKEIIARGKGAESIVIFRKELKEAIEISIPNKFSDGIGRFSLKTSTAGNQLFFSAKDIFYIYEYKKNPMYFLQYPAMLGLFFVLLIVFSLIERAQKLRAEQKYETEKRMATLQLKALENQLNPHFNLNILNSIGALYETNEIEKAQYYFGKYGKLLRKSLLLSGQIAIPIQEEIEFVTNYLELEKLRTNFSFDYKIEGEDTLRDIEIPKMLIHTFTENAVKHGIKHLKRKGQINIQFQPLKNQLEILIYDNGIGRKKARQYSLMSTGKGLEIVKESLRIYFNLKKIKIDYKITDLYKNDGNPSGTEVKIIVPS